MDNPLVSFVVIAYNQERFVADAVRSALSQTYSPLEIVLSDDCSPDSTYEVMKAEAAAYHGPHKIILNRNPINLGLAGNLNRTWELSSGRFCVIQAGDDMSLPQRTEKVVRRWMDKSSPVDLVCCPFEEVDINGRPTGFIQRNVVFVPELSQKPRHWRCGATGACAAYSRTLHEDYGPLDPHLFTEDWVYSFRAWLASGIGVLDEPLVQHRSHDECLSIVYRDIPSVKDGSRRTTLRRKSSENTLAIAKEWLIAWQKKRGTHHPEVENELKRMVEIGEYDVRAFDATRLEAMRLAFLIILKGGRLHSAAKILVRHVLRWDWDLKFKFLT
jgi:glycosyltransferase involved in cell wall biosynthesis